MRTDLNDSREKIVTLLGMFGAKISSNLGEAVVIGVECNAQKENPDWMRSTLSYDDCVVTFLVKGERVVTPVKDFNLKIAVGWYVEFLK